MRIELWLALEHGILFLSDPYHDDDVPPDTGAASVTSTETCIAFQVPAYIDGDAHIIIGQDPYPSGEDPIFSNILKSFSSVVSISDSNRFNYFMMPLDGKEAHIEIWRFGGHNEGRWIKISPLKIFK